MVKQKKSENFWAWAAQHNRLYGPMKATQLMPSSLFTILAA
jgi:hypothetical protein